MVPIFNAALPVTVNNPFGELVVPKSVVALKVLSEFVNQILALVISADGSVEPPVFKLNAETINPLTALFVTTLIRKILEFGVFKGTEPVICSTSEET